MRRAFGPDRITQASARAAFALWRAGATDAAIMTETLAGLSLRYKLPVRELEAGLNAAQDMVRRRANG